MSALPPSAGAWLASARGAVGNVLPLASSQGRVWKVELPGAPVVVKHGPAPAVEREVWGLQVATAGVPAILARPEPTVLILEWRPGEPAETAASMRAAGAWLRRFHAEPISQTDPLDVREALARRHRSWLSRASSTLDVSAVEALDFEPFAGLPRVPCHRDFTPSNWLWDDGAGLTVIDFGQSRADVRLWDLVKLEGETFRRRPELRAPFYEAYGELNSDDAQRLRTLVMLHGLQTAVWGDLHDDAGFSQLGRWILRP